MGGAETTVEAKDMWQEKGTQKHQTRLAQYRERKGVVCSALKTRSQGCVLKQ